MIDYIIITLCFAALAGFGFQFSRLALVVWQNWEG